MADAKDTAREQAAQHDVGDDVPRTESASELRGNLRFVDRMSQEGNRKIESIARIALGAVKLSTANPESIIRALQEIIDVAIETSNDINVAAEACGASWRDEGLERRLHPAGHRVMNYDVVAGT